MKKKELQQEVQRISQILREKGAKWSHQRATIIRVLLLSDTHLSAEDLLTQVRKIDPSIGQATVYRTLSILEKHHIVESHHFGQKFAVYEAKLSNEHHHDHLICEETGEIIEFHHKAIEHLQEKIAREHGYEVVDHRMELYGIPFGKATTKGITIANTEDAKDIWQRYLKQEGKKLSTQREKIVEIFMNSGRHWTAEELFEHVKKDEAKLGRATVYRSLNTLVKTGLAQPHQFGSDQTSFEAIIDSSEHHDHLICIETGKIIEFYDEELEKLQDEVAAQYNMQLTSHVVEIFGRPIKKS